MANKLTAEQLKARDEQLRSIMGEKEFTEWQEHQHKLEQRELLKQASEIATVMCVGIGKFGEDGYKPGKYSDKYMALEKQLQAIYDKAFGEAKTQVGYIEPVK